MPRQVATYGAHPPAWKMSTKVLVAVPTGDAGHFTGDCEWQWMPVRELWHRSRVEDEEKNHQSPKNFAGLSQWRSWIVTLKTTS